MAQVPECPICLQAYNEHDLVPRNLACGHSLCEECLVQLDYTSQPSSSSLATNENNVSPSAASGGVICCPECKYLTRLATQDKNSLPKNIVLIRLLPNLIREEDSTSKDEPAGRDTGEAEGGAARSGRSGDSRKRKAGEYSSDPGSSSSVVDRSWLLPVDLYSENSSNNSDVRRWILPEKSIKLRGQGEEDSPLASSRFRLVVSNDWLCANVFLERDRLSSSVPVSLRQLKQVSCAPHPQQDDETTTTTTSYEDSVLEAWEGCHPEVKTELLILFRISLLSRGLCNVLGVWMNRQRNALFLVTQTLAQDGNVCAWEMIKTSFQRSEESLLDVKSNSTSGQDAATHLSSAASKMTRPAKLSKAVFAAQQKLSPSALVRQMRLGRVGLEICEALREVHSQGFIFGLLSRNCFVLDRLGCLVIDFNAVLNERSSLYDANTRLNGGSISNNNKYQNPTRGGSGGVENTPFKVFDGRQNYKNSCWRYMSPETLSLLKDPNWKTTGGGDASSSSSNESHHCITCKTDVWSLGCLLIEFVCGTEPYEGLNLQEVFEKIFYGNEKPWDLLTFILDSYVTSVTAGLGSLLSKCLEFDPKERPQLDVLYRNFTELGWGSDVTTPTRRSSIPPEQQYLQSSADQKYWVLCLSGFVRDGYPISWHIRQADVEESQIRRTAANDGRDLQPCGLEHKGSLAGHRGPVTALVVCGVYILSASNDKTIRVWSLESHELKQTLQGQHKSIGALAVQHDTPICFSGHTDGTICAWKFGEDSAEDPLIATWQDHDDNTGFGVICLAVSADGVLYSGSGDRTVKAWSLQFQNFKLLGIMTGHESPVSALLVDGELLYSGSWDDTIHVWRRSDHNRVAVYGGPPRKPFLGGVQSLCMSDDRLFAGHINGAIQVWRDEECLTTVDGAHDAVVSALYVEGDFLYTGSWDQKIKVWKVDKFLSDPSSTLVMRCCSDLSSIVSDGDQLFAAFVNGAIEVYSLAGD